MAGYSAVHIVHLDICGQRFREHASVLGDSNHKTHAYYA